MTSTVENIDPTTVKIVIAVSDEEFAPMLAHAYEHLGEGVTIPGFRKGKVPAKILEQRIGKGAAIEHAINDGLPEWYTAAIEEHSLHPMGQPDIELTRAPGEGEDGLEFAATVAVRPEFTLPDPATLTLKIGALEVSEADIDARLDNLRARFGTLVGVDRPAATGDFVTLDLTATIGDTEVDAVQGTSYEVGSGSMLEGLDAVVDGLSAGEETSYEGPLAAGDHAGETALIRVKVTAVKERELPEADDEFAQLASEFDTLAELREDLRSQAARIQLNNLAVGARAALLKKLEEATDFELPGGIVEREVHDHLENEGRLEDDEHRAEVTKEATEALRSQILLDQLAEDLEIVAAEYEVIDYLVSMSRQYGMDPEAFIDQMQRANRIPGAVADVVRSKASAIALRKATVTDDKGTVIDLTPVIGDDETDAAREAEHAKAREGRS